MATPIPSNRAPLDARMAAEAIGGRVTRLRGLAPTLACGVTTDSRAVAPGGAFVALRGAHHDGHAFLLAAVDAGAVLLVVEQGRAPAGANVDIVEVDDTLDAWGRLARAHLRTWRRATAGARVVAITGSAGKTTTKELCAAMLRAVGECHATLGNLNNRVGLPAVLFGVEPRHRFVVLEMGMSVRGEIAALGALVEPDVGVVTNVGLAHAGGVGGTVDDVASEKGALFAAVAAGGSVVANADDRAVMAQAARVPDKRRVTFGKGEGADVRLVAREPTGIDSARVVVGRAGRRASFELLIAGEAAAFDFVAALAAAETAAGGLADPLVAGILSSIPTIAGRMNVRRLGDLVVIDDTYNANPASMRAALAALAEMGLTATSGSAAILRRVAVLGEMKEIGPAAEREHAEIGEAVAAAGVKLLISCGGAADTIAHSAARRGIEVLCAADARDAARLSVQRVRRGDAILVKASRSVGAEVVVAALAALAEKGAG